MCGRYAFTRTGERLQSDFLVESVDDDLPESSWNIKPTQQITVIVEPAAPPGVSPVRRAVSARWGLIPTWAKTPPRAPLFNARSETADTKPSFRDAAARHRCLVPADGYYEWRGERGHKQPYLLTTDAPFAFAGLYSWWRADPADPWTLTATILTRASAGPLVPIHDRMPVTLDADGWKEWLDLDTPAPDALGEASDRAGRLSEAFTVTAVSAVTDAPPRTKQGDRPGSYTAGQIST